MVTVVVQRNKLLMHWEAQRGFLAACPMLVPLLGAEGEDTADSESHRGSLQVDLQTPMHLILDLEVETPLYFSVT